MYLKKTKIDELGADQNNFKILNYKWFDIFRSHLCCTANTISFINVNVLFISEVTFSSHFFEAGQERFPTKISSN